MLFVCLVALIVTIPAYFPNSAGYPVAFFAVTSIAVIGLYIAYTIPVFLRWRMRTRSSPARGPSARDYRWINPIAFVWVGLCVIIFCLPTSQAGVFFKSRLHVGISQLRPDRDHRGDGCAVTIWYLVSARRSFTGPVRTIEFADDGVTVADAGAWRCLTPFWRSSSPPPRPCSRRFRARG